MLPLHRMILETVAYADVFDYPLTEFEVWKFLLSSDGEGERMKSVSFREVQEILQGSFLSKRLGRFRGFVFLHGREDLVALRMRRQKIADRNIKGAQRIASILRFFPFVRMVGLTGSLAMKNADRGSDWDFFIVLRSGYIWTGRAVVTGLLHLFGLRRHGGKVARRACLNFWVTTESLEIRLKDMFSSNEYFFLIPLFGEKTFAKFQSANAWIRRFRPNFFPARLPHLTSLPDTFFARLSRNVFEVLLVGLRVENVLRALQKKKIDSNPKTLSPEGIIEATDERLVFLPHPRGPKTFESFLARISDVETAALS
jgi:predicted nucleotidyltransferase